MTDVVENPTVAPRLVRNRGGSSIRMALGRLTTLDQAGRIRYGNMIDDGEFSLSDQPLTLNGANLGDRKRQLRAWLMSTGVPVEVAEAIASRLRPKVTYLHYLGPDGRKTLLVEADR